MSAADWSERPGYVRLYGIDPDSVKDVRNAMTNALMKPIWDAIDPTGHTECNILYTLYPHGDASVALVKIAKLGDCRIDTISFSFPLLPFAPIPFRKLLLLGPSLFKCGW